jgi:hypothetical protein
VTAARDGGEIEALVTDRYLESLLARGAAGPSGLPADRLQPGVRLAAARLRTDLPRVHPSFRFEERLALRLADVAAGMRIPAAAGGEGTVIPFAFGPTRRGGDAGDPLDPLDPAAVLYDGPLDERPDRVRPLLIGGALTSAALSLAGAAYVAWRRTRPATTPMARAVRAVARGRPA